MKLLGSPHVQAVCGYSEATETAEWMIGYAEPRLDLTGANDDLALAVLRGMTTSMEYAFDEGQTLKNRLRLVVMTA